MWWWFGVFGDCFVVVGFGDVVCVFDDEMVIVFVMVYELDDVVEDFYEFFFCLGKFSLW